MLKEIEKKKAISKIKIYISVVLVAVIIIPILYFPYTIAYDGFRMVEYEAKNLKEYGNVEYSAGDCRIVNSKVAIENSYDIYLTNEYGNTESKRHVIAVSKDDYVIDLSRDASVKAHEKLQNYLKRTNQYTVLKVNELGWSYLGGFDLSDIGAACSFLIYYQQFKSHYNTYHKRKV